MRKDARNNSEGKMFKLLNTRIYKHELFSILKQYVRNVYLISVSIFVLKREFNFYFLN